jgi:2-polyprenyl-3-methyl-5-hydroxy-6-metoxy-1,4-benzoquinol methylase
MRHIAEVIAATGLPAQVWEEQHVKAFWDFESRFPQRYFGYLNGGALLKLTRRWVSHTGRVLDYGAGTGFLMEHLLRAGITTAGADLSPDSVARLAAIGKRYPQAFLGAYQTQDSALQAASWDVVYLSEVMEHLTAKTRNDVLAHIFALLRPGGMLIVTVPNDEPMEDLLMINPANGHVLHRWQHEYSFTAHDLQNILAAAGFTNVVTYTCTVTYEHAGVMNLLRRVREKLTGSKGSNLIALAQKPAS